MNKEQINKKFINIGIINSTIVFTIFSIILSLGITVSICEIFFETYISHIICAIIAPLIIAPLVSYYLLRLLFHNANTEEKLLRLSVKDELTGVYNRRFLIKAIKDELARAKRFNDTFSLIIIDIDDFKQINDTYGHKAGDEVLLALCNFCMYNIREVDTFARYGGEEFVLLLPRTNEEKAIKCAERIRESISKNPVLFSGQRIYFTVSIGIKAYDGSADIERLIINADEALYLAKREGKNRIFTFESSKLF